MIYYNHRGKGKSQKPERENMNNYIRIAREEGQYRTEKYVYRRKTYIDDAGRNRIAVIRYEYTENGDRYVDKGDTGRIIYDEIL